MTRKGRRNGNEEEYKEATVQQHSIERACYDYANFLNGDSFTQHFGDHWGVSARQKEGKGIIDLWT